MTREEGDARIRKEAGELLAFLVEIKDNFGGTFKAVVDETGRPCSTPAFAEFVAQTGPLRLGTE